MGFFKEGRIRYMAGGGYGDVNLDFFGFGDITFPRPVQLNTKAGAIIQSLKFRIGDSPFFVGPVQRFIAAKISPARLGDLGGGFLPPEYQDEFEDLIRELLTREVNTSALGVVVEFDTRDSFFSPRSGYKYELEHLWYRDFLGSDIEYELTRFIGLNYWKLSEKFRAGLRLGGEFANVDSFLPPFATPYIDLRGIQSARYQGNYTAVVEGELTWQIDSRWSLLGFAGSGWASRNSGDLKDSPSRVTRGGGFRYLIARRYGFDMGIDIARGPEDTIWYIQAGTAW